MSRLAILCSFVLLFVSSVSRAQFWGYGASPWTMDWDKVAKTYKGMEIGISKGFMSPVFESYYFEEDGKEFVEKKAITKGQLKYHWGFYYGFAIRLTEFDEKSALGMNIGLMYNVMEMTSGEKDVPVGFGQNVPEVIFSYVALPISLDYKSGAEAAWNRYEKSMFSFGVGVAPKFTTAGIAGNATARISPFVKGEFGYFVGLAFKLRATYFIGEQKFEDGPLSDDLFGNGFSFGSYSPDLSVTSGGELVISLIVMPFSRSWY